nr:hypothetical protein Iba_chr08aCG9680 [Ipomoea batatas]
MLNREWRPALAIRRLAPREGERGEYTLGLHRCCRTEEGAPSRLSARRLACPPSADDLTKGEEAELLPTICVPLPEEGAALLPCTPSEGKPPPFIQPGNGRNRERRPYRFSFVPPEGKSAARFYRDPLSVARRRRETRWTGKVAHCRWRSRTARWMATPRRACCRSCFSAREGERRRKQGRLTD